MYKNYFFRIFIGIFLVVSVSFFSACKRKSDGEGDNSNTMVELQKQLDELQQSGNSEQATDLIRKLQQQITALQQEQGTTQDPQINALKSQVEALERKNIEIAELQRQIDELSKKTFDGSSIMSCLCRRYTKGSSVYDRIIEGSGANRAAALQNVKETCENLHKPIHNASPYVTDCTIKE